MSYGYLPMTKLSDIMTPKLISRNITAAIRRSSTGLPSIANCFLYKASKLYTVLDEVQLNLG